MKKHIAWMLAVLLLAIACMGAGCKHNETLPDDTVENPSGSEDETSSDLYADDLPDTLDDYDGKIFRMLVGDGGVGTNYITEDPGTRETVLTRNVYQSTVALEDRFGIRLDYTGMDANASGYIAFMQEIRNTNVAGGNEIYDVVSPAYWYGMVLAAEGQFQDLNQVRYIDFSKPYWTAGFNNTTELFGIRYAAVGDFCLGNITSLCMIAFNTELISSRQMTSPFTHFENNTWTLDTMFGMAAEMYEDLNADNASSVGDMVGLIASSQTVDAFFPSSGFHIVEANGNELELTKYSEPAENLYQMLRSRFYGNDSYLFANDQPTVIQEFTNGHALFAATCIDRIITLRSMQGDYGLIVYPKFDSSQQNYVTGTAGTAVLAIPNAVTTPDCSGLVLEALCASFYQSVRPAYIGVILEGQTAKDPTSAEMINLAIDTVYWDFGFVNHNALGAIAEFSSKMAQYDTFRGWYDSFERVYKGKISNYLKTYNKGDGGNADTGA